MPQINFHKFGERRALDAGTFTPEEESILLKFFSSTTDRVYVVQLPQETAAALFARISRTSLSPRQVFLKEFYASDPERYNQMPGAFGVDPRTDALMRRVVDSYGDDSVQQLGGLHVVFQDITQADAKLIENLRFGSYLEKSTRYVRFDERDAEGRWLVRLPTDGTCGAKADRLANYVDALMNEYSRLVSDYQTKFENLAGDDAAKRSAARAKACDVARGLLPVATMTTVGVFGSFQMFNNLVVRLLTNQNVVAENYHLGVWLEEVLKAAAPTQFRRLRTAEHPEELAAEAYIELASREVINVLVGMTEVPTGPVKLQEIRNRGGMLHTEMPSGLEMSMMIDESQQRTNLLEVAARAALEHGFNTPSDTGVSMDYIRKMLEEDVEKAAKLVEAYISAKQRRSRRDRPGRALEAAVYDFSFLMSFYAFRDIHRHRPGVLMFWSFPNFANGWVTPEYLEAEDERKRWSDTLNSVRQLFTVQEDEAGDFVALADLDRSWLLVPMACRCHVNMLINARAAYHFCELRSGVAGDMEYRRIAWFVHACLKWVHPVIGDGMIFVDHNQSEFAREAQERRRMQKENGGA